MSYILRTTMINHIDQCPTMFKLLVCVRRRRTAFEHQPELNK